MSSIPAADSPVSNRQTANEQQRLKLVAQLLCDPKYQDLGFRLLDADRRSITRDMYTELASCVLSAAAVLANVDILAPLTSVAAKLFDLGADPFDENVVRWATAPGFSSDMAALVATRMLLQEDGPAG